jgi:arylsulfatase A-like enzyme
MAVWFGLVTGGVEALMIEILYLANRCLFYISPYIWTIPISDGVVFAIPGLGFYLWARQRGVSGRLRKIAFFVFCAFSVSTIVLTICSLFGVKLLLPAVIVLAAGIASQLARLVGKCDALLHSVFLRTGSAIITLALLAGVVTQSRYWWIERQSLKTLPPSAGTPNVLLIVLDTVRAKSTSLYGYERETTPNIKRWAARGALFDEAVSSAPFTFTSHASMFTGKYPQELAADWNVPLERNIPTLAEVLHAHGYVTAGFVGNTWYAGRQTGLDRGFGHYIAHRFGLDEILVRSALCRTLLHLPGKPPPARVINQSVLRWVGETPRRPFFAFINYCDCHVPYEPESEEQTASREEQRQVFTWGTDSWMAPQPEMDPAMLRLARDAYENCLHGLDRHVGELLKALEERGDLKNTLVVITSDHGEQFGEHGLIQHADSLYRPALHVPLLIIAPNGAAAGTRITQMVTLRDLPATILTLLSVPASGITGDSFAAAITNAATGPLPAGAKFAQLNKGINFPVWHPNSTGAVSAVFLGGKYLVRNPGGEEVYDFHNDPEERTNLLSKADSRDVVEQLRRLMPGH